MSFDNNQALNEGWDLFDVDGRIQLQRIDDPGNDPEVFDYDKPKFPSDTDAIIFVAEKARESSYHYDALTLLGSLSENLV